ncbi:helix-turn-helix domain-containing protein [Paraburkholderia sp. A3RO-2L]|uniref:helix-turn-helix domain-containing protein n=1 Tax=Paraburkholderia sp. A3RO-2L TaxID=3028376 RepID=UPI003DA7E569
MLSPTQRQLSMVELADRGMTLQQIAARLGVSVTFVQRELARVACMVLDGTYTPTPLPIEVAAVRGGDVAH